MYVGINGVCRVCGYRWGLQGLMYVGIERFFVYRLMYVSVDEASVQGVICGGIVQVLTV